MEIIEIKSAHSLRTSITAARPQGVQTYQVNCRQYLSVYQQWQKQGQAQSEALGVMTLKMERIWLTEAEGQQVVSAIQASSSPLVLD